jgi:hypothetical protein
VDHLWAEPNTTAGVHECEEKRDISRKLAEWENFQSFGWPHTSHKGTTPCDILRQKLAWNTLICLSTLGHQYHTNEMLWGTRYGSLRSLRAFTSGLDRGPEMNSGPETCVSDPYFVAGAGFHGLRPCQERTVSLVTVSSFGRDCLSGQRIHGLSVYDGSLAEI